MGIAQSVAAWLKNKGYDAIHLNDENLFKLEDKLILQKAITETRIIITSDTDFTQILALEKIANASVIQFRTSIFTPANIREKLELIFSEFSTQLDGNFIITVEDKRMRYRRLPI